MICCSCSRPDLSASLGGYPQNIVLRQTLRCVAVFLQQSPRRGIMQPGGRRQPLPKPAFGSSPNLQVCACIISTASFSVEQQGQDRPVLSRNSPVMLGQCSRAEATVEDCQLQVYVVQLLQLLHAIPARNRPACHSRNGLCASRLACKLGSYSS